MLRDRLIHARKQAGLSISQAAKLTDLHPEILRSAEAGEHKLGKGDLEYAAKIYGVPYSWLAEGTNAEGFVLKHHRELFDMMRYATPELFKDFLEQVGFTNDAGRN